MDTITSVRRNVKNGGRCSVFVNDEFLVDCPIDVAASLGLRKGLEMTNELERTLRGEYRRMVLKQKTYHFATYKPRTEKQVRTYLVGRESSAEEIEIVLSWLREFRLIDDKNYAEQFIEAAKERKPISRLMARRKLIIKGVPEDIVDSVLEERYQQEDALEAARRVAVKKLRSLITETEKKREEKLVRFLQYRGYPWEIIRAVIGEIHLSSSVALVVTSLIILSQASTVLMAQTITSCNRSRLPETINRFQTTTQPVLAVDGSLFLDRKLHPNNVDGGVQDPDDVWIARKDASGSWLEPQQESFTTFLGPDVLFTFTTDGLHALVVGKYKSVGNKTDVCLAIISRASHIDKFSVVEPIAIPSLATLGRNFYASMSDDRQTIVLAVDRNLGTGLDLYVTNTCAGAWSEPKPLGPAINTSSFEGAPCIAHDGRSLYFASSGRENRVGKSDMYLTRRIGNGWEHWSTPINLGSCINTTEDETSFSVIGRGDSAFINSWDSKADRTGVYMVELPDDVRPLPSCSYTGRVVDAVSGKAIRDVQVLLRDSSSSCDAAQITIDTATQTFRIALSEQHRYYVATEADHYVSHRQSIGIKTLDSTTELRLTVKMFDTRVPLASVYFDRGVAQLNDVNLLQLRQLVEQFDIRQIGFDVVGYTDVVGSKSTNEILSKQRAESVTAELIQLGLIQERVRAMGRGIEMPGTLLELTENPQSRRVDIFPADKSRR